MTREEVVQYWEQFDAEIDDIYDTASEEERDVLEEQRKMVEFTISALRQQETVTNRNGLKVVEIDQVKPLTLDDAISHLDDTLSDTGRKWSCESCRMEHVQLREWLAELRDIKQKRNAQLTLDELRKMDGEPVWVQSPGIPEYGRWAIVEGVGENCLFLHDDFTCHDYGKTWLAYRKKPEEGTV